MTWPIDDLTNDHLDQGTDDPSQARSELNAAVLKLKDVLAEAADGSTLLTDQNAVSQNLALVTLANIFSALQTIRFDGAGLNIDHQNVTTASDMLQLMRASAMLWNFRLESDDSLGIQNNANQRIITAFQDSLELRLIASDITYGGKSLLASPVFGGYLDAGDVAGLSRLPAGWSATRPSIGRYIVTMSPAQPNTNYSVVATAINENPVGCPDANKTTTTFDIETGTSTRDVNFIMTPIT